SMQQLDHPYSSAYWEDALSHIKDREKRRRRVFGAWWILAGVILISAGSLIWWSITENRKMQKDLTEKQLAGLAQAGHSNKEGTKEKDIENEIVKGEYNLLPVEKTKAQVKKINPPIRN